MSEESEGPRTTPLRPRTNGRSVPIPPVIPTVVAVSLILGLIIGFGLASKPGPAALPSVPAFVASLPAVTPVLARPAATPLELPPADGLTFAQAQAVLKLAAVGSGSPSAVVSARVARFGEVASGALPADRWVWAFVVRGSFDSAATELAIFDYQTGEFLEDRIPAYP
jgi:hypothetical protein